jgi:hypothetical protein
MTDARLAARRASDRVCATCQHWEGRDGHGRVAKCEANGLTTLDLASCSGWAEHHVLTGRIMKPDEIIDER